MDSIFRKSYFFVPSVINEQNTEELLCLRFMVESLSSNSEYKIEMNTFKELHEKIEDIKSERNVKKLTSQLRNDWADYLEEELDTNEVAEQIVHRVYRGGYTGSIIKPVSDKMDAVVSMISFKYGDLATKFVESMNSKSIRNSEPEYLLNEYYGSGSKAPHTKLLSLVYLAGVLNKRSKITSVDCSRYLYAVTEKLLECYIMLSAAAIIRLKENIESSEALLIEAKNVIISTSDENERLNTVISDLKQHIKELKHISDSAASKKDKANGEIKKQLQAQEETIKALQSDIKKKEKQLSDNEKIIAELRDIKPTNIFKSLVEKQAQELADVKASNREKQLEIKKLKKMCSKYEEIDIVAEFMTHLKSNSHNIELIEKVFNCVSKMMPTVENEMATNNIESMNDVDEKDLIPEFTIKPTPILGYCRIDEGKHFVVAQDGTEYEIQDIRDSFYIAENQFVTVDENRSLVTIHASMYNEDTLPGAKNVSVVLKAGYIFEDYITGREIKNIPNQVRLKDKQVIQVDSNFNFMKYYRSPINNADAFMKSARSKGHEFYYVLNILKEGMFLRNIETGEETFKSIDTVGQEVIEHNSISVFDNKVIIVFRNLLFYTSSTFYTKHSFGTIQIIDDTVYAKKMCGEIVRVKNIPTLMQLQDGQVIKMDEFNNFCRKDTMAVPPEEIKRPELPSKYKTSLPRPESNNIAVSKSVLIVGNPGYKDTYKLALLKYGFSTEVIDGFTPFARVQAAAKNKDIVIVSTQFVSHDNMWKIKDNIDAPVLYPESDGANRIIEKIFEYFNEDKKMQA